MQRITDAGLAAIKDRVVAEGLTSSELQTAIEAKMQEESAAGLSEILTEEQLSALHQAIVDESYTVMYRIQDELAHNVPRGQPDAEQGTGAAHDLWAALHTGDEGDVDERAIVGLSAASHTYGLKDMSSFVSMALDHTGLANSSDTGAGAEAVEQVVKNAKYLCSYLVPNEFVWTPDSMLEAIRASDTWAEEAMFGGDGTTPEDWLGTEEEPGTPRQETEVLYYGWDLAKYRTGHEANPYKD
ncbi:MAG: hypothetical protein AAF567_06575 [Actinomycetota bacterium]